MAHWLGGGKNLHQKDTALALHQTNAPQSVHSCFTSVPITLFVLFTRISRILQCFHRYYRFHFYLRENTASSSFDCAMQNIFPQCHNA